MKNENGILEVSPVVTGKKVKSLNKGKNLIKAKVDVYSTVYGQNVLTVNQKLKATQKSLGGCRSVLLSLATEIELPAKFVNILKLSKEQTNYKILQDKVRTSKTGNYSPFYLLQSLNKNYEFFKANFKK